MVTEKKIHRSGGKATAGERKARLLARGWRLDVILLEPEAIEALRRLTADGTSQRVAVERALAAALASKPS